MIINIFKVAKKYNKSIFEVIKIALKLKKQGFQKYDLDIYFESKKLNVLFEEMITYYRSYTQIYDKEYYLKLLEHKQYKITLEDYDDYIKIYKKKYDMYTYKMFLEGKELNISEEYFDIYLKECHGQIDLYTFNNIYKTKPEFLTYIEYDEYLRNFKLVYTLDQFKKFTIARSVGITYDLYIKYLETKEGYENYPSLEKFVLMHNAAKLNVKYNQSDLNDNINLQEFNYKILNDACKLYNVSKSTFELFKKDYFNKISFKNFSLIVNNLKIEKDLDLAIYHLNKNSNQLYKKFLLYIATDIYGLTEEEFLLWNGYYSLKQFLISFLHCKEKGFTLDEIKILIKNKVLENSYEYQRNLLISLENNLDINRFNYNAYLQAKNLYENDIESCHIYADNSLDYFYTISNLMLKYKIFKVFIHHCSLINSDKLGYFYFVKEIYFYDEVKNEISRLFNKNFPNLKILHFLSKIESFKFDLCILINSIEELYIQEVDKEVDVYGIESFKDLKTLNFGITPKFIIDKKYQIELDENKIYGDLTYLRHLKIEAITSSRNDSHYISLSKYKNLVSVYIDYFRANGPIKIYIPENVKIVFFNNIYSQGYKGELRISFEGNSKCMFLYEHSYIKNDIYVSCNSKYLVYTNVNNLSTKSRNRVHEYIPKMKCISDWSFSDEKKIAVLNDNKSTQMNMIKLIGKSNVSFYTRSDGKSYYLNKLIDNFNNYDELIGIQVLKLEGEIDENFFPKIKLQTFEINCALKSINSDIFKNIETDKLIFTTQAKQVFDFARKIKFNELICENRIDVYMQLGMINKINIDKMNLYDKNVNLNNTNVIAKHDFKQSNIETLLIPSNISIIEEEAFLFANKLEEIKIEGNPKINPNAFYALTNIKYIDFGNLERIFAYYGNSPLFTLNKIKFSSNLEYIGENAFMYSPIEYINDWPKCEFKLSNLIIKIEPNAFLHTKINKLNLCGVTIEEAGNVISMENFDTVIIPSNIKLNELGKIFEFKNIENIICDYSYGGEIDFNNHKLYIPSHIKNIELPYCVTTIFNKDKVGFLEKIKITKNTTFIDEELLNKVKLECDYEGYNNARIFRKLFKSNLPVMENKPAIKNKKLTLYSLDDIDLSEYKEIILDESITVIPDRYFMNLVNLNKLIINGTITKIGENAFFGCMNLKTIENISKVYSIGKGAFCNCLLLENMSLCNLVSKLNNETFMNCISLKNIFDYSEISSVGIDCFINCKSLEELVFSPKIKSMDSSLMNCISLKKLYIFNDLESFTFDLYNCNSDIDIYMPKIIEEFNEVKRDSFKCKYVINTFRQKNWNIDTYKYIIRYYRIDQMAEIRDKCYKEYNYELSLSQFLKEKATRIRESSESNKAEREKVKKVQGFENRFTTVNPRASWNLSIQESNEEDIPVMEEIKAKQYSEVSLDELPFNISDIRKNIIPNRVIDNTNLEDIVTNIFNYNVIIKYKTDYVTYYGFSINSKNKLITNVVKINPNKNLSECEIDFNLEIKKDVYDSHAYFIIVKEENDEFEIIVNKEFKLNIAFAIDSDFDF